MSRLPIGLPVVLMKRAAPAWWGGVDRSECATTVLVMEFRS